MIVRNFFSSGEEGGKLALLPQSVFLEHFFVSLSINFQGPRRLFDGLKQFLVCIIKDTKVSLSGSRNMFVSRAVVSNFKTKQSPSITSL